MNTVSILGQYQKILLDARGRRPGRRPSRGQYFGISPEYWYCIHYIVLFALYAKIFIFLRVLVKYIFSINISLFTHFDHILGTKLKFLNVWLTKTLRKIQFLMYFSISFIIIKKKLGSKNLFFFKKWYCPVKRQIHF